MRLYSCRHVHLFALGRYPTCLRTIWNRLSGFDAWHIVQSPVKYFKGFYLDHCETWKPFVERSLAEHILSMFAFALLSLPIALALAQSASSQCVAPRPLSLCCQELEPFSDDAYVWNDCGVYVSDESILVGTLCEAGVSCAAPTYEGFYNICCSGYMNCGSGTDGPIGLNCTGTEVTSE